MALKQAVRERVEYILVFFHEFNCKGGLTRFALHAAMPSNMQMSRHWGTIKRHIVLLPSDLYQTERVPPKKVRHSRKSLWGFGIFLFRSYLVLSYNCIKEQAFNVCIDRIAYRKLTTHTIGKLAGIGARLNDTQFYFLQIYTKLKKSHQRRCDIQGNLYGDWGLFCFCFFLVLQLYKGASV